LYLIVDGNTVTDILPQFEGYLYRANDTYSPLIRSNYAPRDLGRHYGFTGSALHSCFVSRSNPRYDELVRLADEALATQQKVWLIRSNAGPMDEIVDISPMPLDMANEDEVLLLPRPIPRPWSSPDFVDEVAPSRWTP
jgi:hypothetical protein